LTGPFVAGRFLFAVRRLSVIHLIEKAATNTPDAIDEERMAAAVIRDNESAEAAKRPTILVVEDEVLIRMMIADYLRLEDFIVIEAASADEALRVLESSTPVDLLFTDVRMPGAVDGFTLIERARALKPDVKIVVTSGHAGAQLRGAAADWFVSKPYDLGQVLDRIARLLNLKTA
jgi:CheY-like chemotaxis protein